MLVAVFVGYVPISFLLNERQFNALAERIRILYALPASTYHFPLAYLGEVVRPGMTPSEVDTALRRLEPLDARVSWHHNVEGGEWIAQRLLVPLRWAPDYPLDIFYRDGMVSNLDSGYYISERTEITPDSAQSLLNAATDGA